MYINKKCTGMKTFRIKHLTLFLLLCTIFFAFSLDASAVYINCCEMSATGGMDISGNPICECAGGAYYTACGTNAPALSFICPPEFLNPTPQQSSQPNVNTIEGCNTAGHYWYNSQCISSDNANSYCQTTYGSAFATRYNDGTMGCSCNAGYNNPTGSRCELVAQPSTEPNVNTIEGCNAAGHYWYNSQCINLENANYQCTQLYGNAFATRNSDGTMGCSCNAGYNNPTGSRCELISESQPQQPTPEPETPKDVKTSCKEGCEAQMSACLAGGYTRSECRSAINECIDTCIKTTKCETGFAMSDGMCCPEGMHNSEGVCCEKGYQAAPNKKACVYAGEEEPKKINKDVNFDPAAFKKFLQSKGITPITFDAKGIKSILDAIKNNAGQTKGDLIKNIKEFIGNPLSLTFSRLKSLFDSIDNDPQIPPQQKAAVKKTATFASAYNNANPGTIGLEGRIAIMADEYRRTHYGKEPNMGTLRRLAEREMLLERAGAMMPRPQFLFPYIAPPKEEKKLPWPDNWLALNKGHFYVDAGEQMENEIDKTPDSKKNQPSQADWSVIAAVTDRQLIKEPNTGMWMKETAAWGEFDKVTLSDGETVLRSPKTHLIYKIGKKPGILFNRDALMLLDENTNRWEFVKSMTQEKYDRYKTTTGKEP